MTTRLLTTPYQVRLMEEPHGWGMSHSPMTMERMLLTEIRLPIVGRLSFKPCAFISRLPSCRNVGRAGNTASLEIAKSWRGPRGYRPTLLSLATENKPLHWGIWVGSHSLGVVSCNSANPLNVKREQAAEPELLGRCRVGEYTSPRFKTRSRGLEAFGRLQRSSTADDD